MSFLSVLKDGAKDVAALGGILTPAISAFNPAAGAVAGLITTSVVQAEALFPADKQGVTKKDAVMTEVMAALPLLQVGLQLAGKKFDVTPATESQVSAIIDAVVSIFNNLASLKSAIK